MKIGELKQLITDNELDDDVEITFQSTCEDTFLCDIGCRIDEDVPFTFEINMQDMYVSQDIKTSVKELLIVCDVKIEEVQ